MRAVAIGVTAVLSITAAYLGVVIVYGWLLIIRDVLMSVYGWR